MEHSEKTPPPEIVEMKDFQSLSDILMALTFVGIVYYASPYFLRALGEKEIPGVDT